MAGAMVGAAVPVSHGRPDLVPYCVGAVEPQWEEELFIHLVKQQIIRAMTETKLDSKERLHSNVCSFLSATYPAPDSAVPGVDRRADFAQELRVWHDRLAAGLGAVDDQPVQVVPAAVPVDPQRGPSLMRLRLWNLSFSADASPRGLHLATRLTHPSRL